MTAVTGDRATLQEEWIRNLQGLVGDICGRCDAHGWAVHVTDKPITESKLGEC
jgi:hypothetical protein